MIRDKRDIFNFWDGDNERYVDPLKIYRELISENSNLLNDLQDLELVEKLNESSTKNAPCSIEKMQNEVLSRGVSALNKIVASTRKVFKIKDYEVDENCYEIGLSDEEVINVFMKFFEYFNLVKKNTKLNPTYVDCTDLSVSV